MSDEEFDDRIAAQAARRLKAQGVRRDGAWPGLGMFGVIGWAVAVPTVLGAWIGIWWDKHHPNSRSWTLVLLVAGLVVGCANAWYWVARQTGGDD